MTADGPTKDGKVLRILRKVLEESKLSIRGVFLSGDGRFEIRLSLFNIDLVYSESIE